MKIPGENMEWSESRNKDSAPYERVNAPSMDRLRRSSLCELLNISLSLNDCVHTNPSDTHRQTESCDYRDTRLRNRRIGTTVPWTSVLTS
jgi:hypothetical protein